VRGPFVARVRPWSNENRQDLFQDMEELLEDANEFQEALSRSYGVPDELNEADLEAELEALTDELLEQDVEGGGASSYLDDISRSTLVDTLPPTNPTMVRPISIGMVRSEALFVWRVGPTMSHVSV
jgi:hypothetical protein